MTPPKGTDLPAGTVYKLFKGLYGLKQSGRVWNQTFDRAVRRRGWMPLPSCSTIYTRGTGDEQVILVTYVDDTNFVGPNKERVQAAKAELLSDFKGEDRGPLQSFVGISISYDQTTGELSIQALRVHTKRRRL